MKEEKQSQGILRVKFDHLYLYLSLALLKEQSLKGAAGQNVIRPPSAQPNAGGGFTGHLLHTLFSFQ